MPQKHQLYQKGESRSWRKLPVLIFGLTRTWQHSRLNVCSQYSAVISSLGCMTAFRGKLRLRVLSTSSQGQKSLRNRSRAEPAGVDIPAGPGLRWGRWVIQSTKLKGCFPQCLRRKGRHLRASALPTSQSRVPVPNKSVRSWGEQTGGIKAEQKGISPGLCL